MRLPINMPLFDYECESCGEIAADVRVPRYDHPVECRCGAIMLRLPASPAFALKGAGFYVNDSKAGPPPERKQPHYTGVDARAVSPDRAFRK